MYTLLHNDTINIDGHKLYRIKALDDIPNYDGYGYMVKSGTIGGYIESMKNLGGYSWVYDNACVYGDANIDRGSSVSGNARVYGDAHLDLRSQASDNAQIYDRAWLVDSRVCDDAHVYDSAELKCVSVKNTAIVHDAVRLKSVIVINNADIGGCSDSEICYCRIGKDALICGFSDVIRVNIHGLDITFFKRIDGQIGCESYPTWLSSVSLNDFRYNVKRMIWDKPRLNHFMSMVDLVDKYFKEVGKRNMDIDDTKQLQSKTRLEYAINSGSVIRLPIFC